MVTQYSVNAVEFQNAVKEALTEVSDLRVPFNAIANTWFKSNKAIFSTSSKGKYDDLKPSTKKQKFSKWGFIYPILYRSGFLADSLMIRGHSASILEIGKTNMALGTKVEYGIFHQLGTVKMKARPFVLLGPEQVAPKQISKRKELWIKQITDHVERATGRLRG